MPRPIVVTAIATLLASCLLASCAHAVPESPQPQQAEPITDIEGACAKLGDAYRFAADERDRGESIFTVLMGVSAALDRDELSRAATSHVIASIVFAYGNQHLSADEVERIVAFRCMQALGSI